jgi:GDPmannose 4,6-dehydratase
MKARGAAAERLREGTGHGRIIASVLKRRALITGVGGQDGSLLAELLVSEGYDVAGIVRRSPSVYAANLAAVLDDIELVDANLLDRESLIRALERIRPREVYNLAAPSFVPRSWDEPVVTAEFAAVGVTSMLEAIRAVDPGIRFYQASSSEIFGRPLETPQTEETPLSPVTPYGVAKAYGHFIVHSYRDRYGVFGCCGILYNHESSRRPLDFLPRKVARAAAAISLGRESTLSLGDLDARRDWGYAPDYVRAMWLMLQQDEPRDYVVATGESHSVRDLVTCAFARVGLDAESHVVSDPSLRRGVAELHDLVGDPAKAHELLGWRPSVTFEELVGILVDAEVELLAGDQAASSA